LFLINFITSLQGGFNYVYVTNERGSLRLYRSVKTQRDQRPKVVYFRGGFL
jgi:hypothetical protein